VLDVIGDKFGAGRPTFLLIGPLHSSPVEMARVSDPLKNQKLRTTTCLSSS
jgi:hypothetical protein